MKKTNRVPQTTVFSIDPKTGKQYLTIEGATDLIYKHIHVRSRNLFQHKYMDVEDLKQEVLLKLSKCTYEPTKSSPITFLFQCAISQLGNIKKQSQTFEKDNELSDFKVFDEGNDEFLMATDRAVDDVTPMDHLLAAEAIAEHEASQLKEKPYKRTRKPKEY